MPWISQYDLESLRSRIGRLEDKLSRGRLDSVTDEISRIKYELCFEMIDRIGEAAADERVGIDFYPEFSSAKTDHRLCRYAQLPEECKNGHEKKAKGGKG